MVLQLCQLSGTDEPAGLFAPAVERGISWSILFKADFIEAHGCGHKSQRDTLLNFACGCSIRNAASRLVQWNWIEELQKRKKNMAYKFFKKHELKRRSCS